MRRASSSGLMLPLPLVLRVIHAFEACFLPTIEVARKQRLLEPPPVTRKMVASSGAVRHAVSDLLKQHAHHLGAAILDLGAAILARALTGRADLIHLMRLRIAFEMIP